MIVRIPLVGGFANGAGKKRERRWIVGLNVERLRRTAAHAISEVESKE